MDQLMNYQLTGVAGFSGQVYGETLRAAALQALGSIENMQQFLDETPNGQNPGWAPRFWRRTATSNLRIICLAIVKAHAIFGEFVLPQPKELRSSFLDVPEAVQAGIYCIRDWGYICFLTDDEAAALYHLDQQDANTLVSIAMDRAIPWFIEVAENILGVGFADDDGKVIRQAGDCMPTLSTYALNVLLEMMQRYLEKMVGQARMLEADFEVSFILALTRLIAFRPQPE